MKRPKTEPDIALYLPGRYLILIEAKFTSPNSFYVDGPRRDAQSLTKSELLDIYQDAALQILDVKKAGLAERVYYQLWRNMVFAEWMALADGKGTQAYHASLTRVGSEDYSCEHFMHTVRSAMQNRFVHFTWETILLKVVARQEAMCLLRRYFASKTAGLLPAFRFEKPNYDGDRAGA